MSLISRARQFLGSGASAGSAAPPSKPSRSAGYMRGGPGNSVLFSKWRPRLRDHNDEITESWEAAAARAIDMIINSGFISGAIDQSVANTVGGGLKLKSAPENSLFGMSDADAQAWARMVEARFALWAGNPQECDIEGKRTFGQMQAAAFRMWYATGEMLSEIVWKKRPWNLCGTKVRVMSPHRIYRESNNLVRLVNGVFLDPDGMAVGYRIRRKDPLLGEKNVDIPARDRYGRAVMNHVFDGLPETHRGIGPLTPVLQVVRQYDQLADATLTSAIVQNLFAATIESQSPTEEVIEGLLTPQERTKMMADGISATEAFLDAHAGFYDGATLDIGINGRLGHLYPGDKLNLTSPQIKGSSFQEFATMLMREFARAAGMDYSSATGDFSGATYYTLGKSNTEIFAVTKQRREFLLTPFCQPIFEAWLEEEIEAERIPFPGGYDAFLINRAAASRAIWSGSPKPEADMLKLAKALEVFDRMGTITDQMMVDALGVVDIEDVYEQRAREASLRRKYGLPEKQQLTATGGAAKAPVNDAEDGADDGADDGQDGDSNSDTEDDMEDGDGADA